MDLADLVRNANLGKVPVKAVYYYSRNESSVVPQDEKIYTPPASGPWVYEASTANPSFLRNLRAVSFQALVNGQWTEIRHNGVWIEFQAERQNVIGDQTNTPVVCRIVAQ